MRKLQSSELIRKTAEEAKAAEKNPLIVVLDNVRSAYNVGSVFRTADAFLIEAVYLCGITAFPPHRQIAKTALGATESVRWKHFKNTEECLADLRNSGYTLLAAEHTTQSIFLHKYFPSQDEKTALIFGNEVDGLTQEIVTLCDSSIEVPQAGIKHSLNVSVCAGIVIWDLINKMKHLAGR